MAIALYIVAAVDAPDFDYDSGVTKKGLRRVLQSHFPRQIRTAESRRADQGYLRDAHPMNLIILEDNFILWKKHSKKAKYIRY